jgi:mono/diheme cytochrome c family protein
MQMKKFFKWFGIVLGSLLGLLIIILAVLYFKGNAAVGKTYEIPAENIPIPTDAASIARGKHFVQAICAGCHTPTLSGQLLLQAPFGTLYSANLTSGKGGAGAEFSDADYIRAIRHGVDNHGRALMLMPAQVFWHFSDSDLADIVAYIKTLPPVDNEQPDPQINALGRIMIGAGMFGPDIVPANVIAHDQRPPNVPIGVTAAYGEYLVSVTGCHDCHGPQLAGGKSSKPGSLDAPNLTPAGDLKTWTAANFIKTIHTGVTPSGRVLNPAEMPWKDFAPNYSDDELTAIFMYLQTLQALPTVKP